MRLRPTQLAYNTIGGSLSDPWSETKRVHGPAVSFTLTEAGSAKDQLKACDDLAVRAEV